MFDNIFIFCGSWFLYLLIIYSIWLQTKEILYNSDFKKNAEIGRHFGGKDSSFLSFQRSLVNISAEAGADLMEEGGELPEYRIVADLKLITVTTAARHGGVAAVPYRP